MNGFLNKNKKILLNKFVNINKVWDKKPANKWKNKKLNEERTWKVTIKFYGNYAEWYINYAGRGIVHVVCQDYTICDKICGMN